MNPRSSLSRFAAALLASTLVLPVGAGGIYKAIDADGNILFTDVPPASEARLEAPRVLSADESALERANARVDLAEHAFAVARQGSLSNAMRMTTAHRSNGDKQRAAFYMKDLLLARAQLLGLRQKPGTDPDFPSRSSALGNPGPSLVFAQ